MAEGIPKGYIVKGSPEGVSHSRIWVPSQLHNWQIWATLAPLLR